jgi:hypothetical protein
MLRNTWFKSLGRDNFLMGIDLHIRIGSTMERNIIYINIKLIGPNARLCGNPTPGHLTINQMLLPIDVAEKNSVLVIGTLW